MTADSNNTDSSLKGQFLIAMPSMMDPNFRQTVTCITEHTGEGALGIVINMVHADIEASMIFDELGIAYTERAGALPVHIGGPVHSNELFILHDSPRQWENSLVVSDNLALGNSREILEAIAAEKGPASFIISLGCAGWGPGQLEWEMQQNAWLTSPGRHEIIFSMPVQSRWENAIRQLGIDPSLLSDTAGHA